jgi:hypothetical protein
MMHTPAFRYGFGVLGLVILACISIAITRVEGTTERAQETTPLHILFIGNSYTYVNNMPGWVRQLSIEVGENRNLETEMVAIGGASLQRHWKMGEALKKIQSQDWDYVVLQEQSTVPLTDPAMMNRYARLFDRAIKKAKAQTIFYLTWTKQDRPETQSILTDSYSKIAKELNARIAPVGPAWQQVQLENPQLNLYYRDGSHPSPIGSYIAACVFYSILSDRTPVGLSPRIYSTQYGTPQSGTQIELEPLSGTEAVQIQQSVESVVVTLNEIDRC